MKDKKRRVNFKYEYSLIFAKFSYLCSSEIESSLNSRLQYSLVLARVPRGDKCEIRANSDARFGIRVHGLVLFSPTGADGGRWSSTCTACVTAASLT